MGAAASPLAAYFGGGFSAGSAAGTHYEDVVDVYDAATGNRTEVYLSQRRYHLCAVAHDGLVYFAGGELNSLNQYSDRVDIYDEATGAWRAETLPFATTTFSAVGLGQKIYFGPGDSGVVAPFVQVYDTASLQWSIIGLPGNGRAFVQALSDGRFVVFACGAGLGPGNYVDILDTATGSWTHTTSPNQNTCAAALIDGRLYIKSCDANALGRALHVLDIDTMTWTALRVPTPYCNANVVSLSPFIVFAAGVDQSQQQAHLIHASLYNTWTNEWRTFPLAIAARFRSATSSDAQGKAYIAGGTRDSGSLSVSTVDIVSVDADIGVRYCGQPIPNSTGNTSTLRAVGFRSVSENFLTLAVHEVPAGSAGIFVVGTQPTVTTMPWGLPGTLCVGGASGPLRSPVSVASADGIYGRTIDLGDLPLIPGGRPAQAGETLYFQGLYRDVVGTPTVRLSEALAVTFEP